MFQVDWFFSEDDLDDLSRLSVNLSLPTDTCEVEPASNHSLLLNNIQKIEGISYLLFIMSYSIIFSHTFYLFMHLSFFISFFLILSLIVSNFKK